MHVTQTFFKTKMQTQFKSCDHWPYLQIDLQNNSTVCKKIFWLHNTLSSGYNYTCDLVFVVYVLLKAYQGFKLAILVNVSKNKGSSLEKWRVLKVHPEIPDSLFLNRSAYACWVVSTAIDLMQLLLTNNHTVLCKG